MDTKAFGARLKAVRESKGLTQEQLAALVESTPTHLSALERGIKVPRLDTFVEIVNALDISSDELLFEFVGQSYKGKSCELSGAIGELPQADRIRILKTIEAMLNI